MSIYIYVSIHIISVSLHAFLLRSSRVCIIEFCVLLHFNQIEYLLNGSEVSYAELRGNNLLEHEEQSRIRSRSR